MIKIENVVLPSNAQWESIIRGTRNPKNSWHLSDSLFLNDVGDYYMLSGDSGPWPDETYVDTLIGPNDHDLMMRLSKGGPVHAKYRRMITVYLDITAPLYWWKEFDTYKVSTVANSCSTMHKIQAKEFTMEDFSHEHLISDRNLCWHENIIAGPESVSTPLDILDITIDALNTYREKFLETNDKAYWWQMIQLLPSSYNQKRTVMLNYEVLHNIYISRKGHKLDEWHRYCEWIESLPYSELITCKKGKENE